MTIAQVPSAAWSLDRLVSSLQSHGWGELDGPANAGLQKVLTALESKLPWESAEGQLTRAQVADAAGMTPKWAGHCLRRLEALGLITWRRGWLDHGQPRAGWIRVSKTRLAEMVRAARGYLDERRARRREETRHRLATTLRQRTVPPWKMRSPLVAPRGTECPPSHSRKYPAQRGCPSSSPPKPSQASKETPLPGCATCGRSEDACQLANRKVPDRLRHTYSPGRTSHATLVAPAHDLHRPPAVQQQRRGWRERVAELQRPTPDPLPLDQADQ